MIQDEMVQRGEAVSPVAAAGPGRNLGAPVLPRTFGEAISQEAGVS